MKPSILLVDDESMLREVMGDVLFNVGYVCVPCGNGTDALRLIEQKLYHFDLLLSDVRMPGTIDGFEVAKQFQAAYPASKVILISGFINEKEAASLSKDRLIVLPKPVRVQQLLEVVKLAAGRTEPSSSGDESNVVTLDPSKAPRQ